MPTQMKLLSTRYRSWQAQIIIKVALVLAICLPVFVIGLNKVNAEVQAKQLELTSTNTLNDNAWKALAVLGFLCGIASLGMSRLIILPDNKSRRILLRELEVRMSKQEENLQNISSKLNVETGITEQMSRHQRSLRDHATSLEDLKNEIRKLRSSVSSPTLTDSNTPENPADANLGIPESSSVNFTSVIANFLADIPSQPAEVSSSLPRSPQEEITTEYQDALRRNDRTQLRRLASAELNITQDSEDLLYRGSATATKLQVVSGGGSYLLIPHCGRNWLFPTAQTLTGFATNQPLKGIFDYERKLISIAEIKQPAEVKEIGRFWEVTNRGVVVVPG